MKIEITMDRIGEKKRALSQQATSEVSTMRKPFVKWGLSLFISDGWRDFQLDEIRMGISENVEIKVIWTRFSKPPKREILRNGNFPIALVHVTVTK